jgi:uncharacterized protein YjbI with pentapeptide repeats
MSSASADFAPGALTGFYGTFLTSFFLVSSLSTFGGSYFGVAVVVFAVVGAFMPVVVVFIPLGFVAASFTGASFAGASFTGASFASGYLFPIAVDGLLSPNDVAGFGYGVVVLEPLF